MAAGAHRWLVLLAVAVAVSASFPVATSSSSSELALVVGQSTALEVVPGIPVRDSPGSKPGLVVGAERVRIYGLSRLKNLKRYFHSAKLKVAYSSSSPRQPSVEVCFHRNISITLGMCPQGQWEKLSKGSWDRTMSPFDHKLLDVRAVGLSSTVLEVTIEEEIFLYRVVFLILGILLMTLAPTLSSSLVFYYSSAMAVGIVLVILVVLFQGMKLLPTGRRSSLAVLMYSSIVGVGSFIISYLSRFLQTLLVQLGISEDMYNPLAVFVVLFIVLFGAWMGFWAVRKFILTEEGSVDTSVAQFVAWSIRILAAVMILLSSVDVLLEASALICSVVVSMLLRRAFRPKVLRRLHKKLFDVVESPSWKSQYDDSSPFCFGNGEYIDRFRGSQDKLLRSRTRQSPLATCNSSVRGVAKSLASGSFYSIFHRTPERRKLSKEEWDELTKDHTKKALEELVSSPDFSKWAAANAERITLTPVKKDKREVTSRWKRLFYWGT